MDMDGQVVHEWRAEFSEVVPDLPVPGRPGSPDGDRELDPHRNYWRDAVLFPNGDLLVITAGFPVGGPGSTNTVTVKTAGEQLSTINPD